MHGPNSALVRPDIWSIFNAGLQPCDPSKRRVSRGGSAVAVALLGSVRRQQHDAAVERECAQLHREAGTVLVREGDADARSGLLLPAVAGVELLDGVGEEVIRGRVVAGGGHVTLLQIE